MRRYIYWCKYMYVYTCCHRSQCIHIVHICQFDYNDWKSSRTQYRESSRTQCVIRTLCVCIYTCGYLCMSFHACVCLSLYVYLYKHIEETCNAMCIFNSHELFVSSNHCVLACIYAYLYVRESAHEFVCLCICIYIYISCI